MHWLPSAWPGMLAIKLCFNKILHCYLGRQLLQVVLDNGHKMAIIVVVFLAKIIKI